jgi:hypothetical protein
VVLRARAQCQTNSAFCRIPPVALLIFGVGTTVVGYILIALIRFVDVTVPVPIAHVLLR